MITNDSSRLIQQGETAIRDNSNCSWERTEDRERRERAEVALRKPVVPKTEMSQYEREVLQEQMDIAAGLIKVHPDGTKTYRTTEAYNRRRKL